MTSLLPCYCWRRRLFAAAMLLTAVLSAGAAVSPLAAQCRPEWAHDWARGAVFYQVFVRSFADSNGDGIGDLAGLTSRLDYLNDGDPATSTDLGVDALWLMPIFASPSYHGYDVTDYAAIESDYGTGGDFDRLLVEAHRRGIRVIVDLVLNHTSREHPWFVDAARGPSARHRAWYVWRGDDPGWTQPWGGSNSVWHRGPDGAFYYGIFWSGMPDLNFDNLEVRAEMTRVARHWLGRGVDGFRLDATRHLYAEGPGELQNDRPATHDFLREFAAAVRSAKPDAVLVGENWTETPAIARYFGDVDSVCGGDELPMNFNFPLAAAILEGVRQGGGDPIREVLAEMSRLYPRGALDAPFLTNHDQIRVATQLGGDIRKLRLAASVLLTLPGAPFIYYGEEIGMANDPAPGDPSKRTPMAWNDTPGGGFTMASATPWRAFAPGRETANVAAQSGIPESLLTHYQQWISLRRQRAALRSGSIELVETLPPSLLGYQRSTAKEKLLVLHNLDLERPADARRWVAKKAVRLWPPVARRNQRFTLPPGTSAVWVLP